MPEQKILNGVDVGAVQETVQAIEKDPGLARFKFKAHNRWIEGGLNRTHIDEYEGARQRFEREAPFELSADEPPVLAGADRGPNPVEHLLNALAACVTTSMVYHAALRGIRIYELESDLEGDIDLRGFLGLSTDVRRGYEKIRVRFKVKTDTGNIERLRAFSKLSPVFDVTSNGTQVDISIEAR